MFKNIWFHAFQRDDFWKIVSAYSTQYPVSFAIASNEAGVLQFFMEHCEIDTFVNPTYKTAIKHAICLKNSEIVKILKPKYSEFVDEDGSLEENIIKFGTPEMVDSLPKELLKTAIEHDVSGLFCRFFTEFEPINDEHPLFYATFTKNIKYLEYMLNNGVSPKIKNKEKLTPIEDILTYFDDFRDLYMIKCLLEHGAGVKKELLKQIPEHRQEAVKQML